MNKTFALTAYFSFLLYPLFFMANVDTPCLNIETNDIHDENKLVNETSQPQETFKIKGHQLYLGSEIYYGDRVRQCDVEEGKKKNSTQTGAIYGIKGGYDYIKRYKFYWGAEALYARGTLRGHSAKGNDIKSIFTNTFAEGRFGYTFQQKSGYRVSLTPFIGGGYYEEKNNLTHPSPISIHNKITFYYFTAGFLSQASLTQCLDVGLNFKVRYMWDPKNCVTHDPDPKVNDCTMTINNQKLQYRVDLPFIYHWKSCVLLSLGPFYEYRHYGRQVNFPYDFFETTMRSYGLSFKFIYNF